jgi:hypothetical protein
MVAGKLLAERQLSPLLLASDEEFRYEVLTKFEDVEIERVGSILTPDLCREVLRLVAAVSPFRDGNDAFLNAAANFLGMPSSQLRTAFGDLESMGVLLRRGYSLRITPDVLSDHILYSACFTKQNQATGYARRLFDAFSEVCPAQVLRNFAELDWRQRRSGGVETDVLSEVWSDIEQQFLDAPNSVRCTILDLLEDVAQFQPERAMPLVEVAIRNPSNAPEDEQLIRFYQFTHKDVLRKLPPLLRRIAFTSDFLPRCCDLLWQLGRDATHEPNSASDHAIRVLQDLAEYDPNKPIAVNQAVLEAVIRWLQEADVHNHRFSPLDVLDALLRKEGYTTQYQGHQIVMSSFLVNFDGTQDVREQVLHTLEACAQTSTRVALRTVQSLDNALAQPHGLMGAAVSVEALESWVPEQLRILELMQGIAERTPDPLVQIKVAEAIQWETRYATSSAVRDKAKTVIQAFPLSYEVRLTRALVQIHGRDWMPEDGEDAVEAHNRYEQEGQKEREALAAEFLIRHPDASEGARVLRERMAAIQVAGAELQSWWFLNVLARRDVEYAGRVSEAIIGHPDDFLAPYLSCFLSAVRSSDALRLVALAQNCTATGDARLCRAVAAVYAHYGPLGTVLPEEMELLLSLAEHTDPMVRANIIAAAQMLGTQQPESAIGLALMVDIGNDTKLADRLCGCFTLDRPLSTNNLTDEQTNTMLGKLEMVEDIDTHYVCAFLTRSARTHPRQVVQLLLDRIARAESLDDNQYRPIPHPHFQYSLEGLGESEEYISLLRTIRDAIQGGKWRTRMSMPRLFQQASMGYSSISLTVLSEWIDSGEAEKLEMAACLLSEAPREFVFTHSGFAIDIITRAHGIANDCGRRVTSSLYKSAVSGITVSTPGQPEPGAVNRSDMARRMANRLQPGSATFKFYKSIETHFATSIRDQLAQDEELEYE